MLFPVVGAFAQDVVGKWKLENGTAIVEIYKSGKVYNGKTFGSRILQKQTELLLWMTRIPTNHCAKGSLWD